MRLFLKSILFSGITILSAGAMAQETFCADVLDHTLAASSSSGFVPGRCTPATGSGASKRTDKNIYMGLVWSFGPKVSAAPDVLLGFRSIHINSSNRVKGADLSMRLLSAKQFEPEGLRLSYVGGNRNSLANLGVGYSFSSGSALLTGAVQASHLRAGADFQIANRAFDPYFELNTLKRIEAAGGG